MRYVIRFTTVDDTDEDAYEDYEDIEVDEDTYYKLRNEAAENEI